MKESDDLIYQLMESTLMGLADAREFIENNRELSKKIIKATKEQKNRILHDPIEDESQYKDLISKIRSDVENAYKEKNNFQKVGMSDPFPMGSSHWIWNYMKIELKEKYGINWYSPADMNPCYTLD